MPLRDCPFLDFGGLYRAVLPVRIINPHNGKHINTIGIIDTGADECAIPAQMALILGHNLQAGVTKAVNTGNGPTAAYSHTTKFDIFHPGTGQLVYTIDDTPIDFMPNLNVVLLGVNSFLSRFILRIDYPNKSFSISNSA